MPTDLKTVFYATMRDGGTTVSYAALGRLWVVPDGQCTTTATYSNQFVEPVSQNWVVVLDRKDPTKPALFNASLPNNTDVPPALAALLTPDNILYYVATGYTSQMPQGELYQTLMENGGGPLLEKSELIATYGGSGIANPNLYMLASVPGTGLVGVEKLVSLLVTFSSSGQGGYYLTFPNYTMMLNMLPSASGYVPVEIGGTDA